MIIIFLELFNLWAFDDSAITDKGHCAPAETLRYLCDLLSKSFDVLCIAWKYFDRKWRTRTGSIA